MPSFSEPVDDFRLAFDTDGEPAPTATVLLHGWPGDRRDYRELRPLLDGYVITPDLRGFGESDKHLLDPAQHYDAGAQARSVAGLLDELAITDATLVGYDVGSRVAQALRSDRPDLVGAMVLAPPLPGAGERIQSPQAQAEFWYQHYHRLDLSVATIDGNRDAVRTYLAHFWNHWSGPDFSPDHDALDALTDSYAAPGAYQASINWYRAGAGSVARSRSSTPPAAADRIATPTVVLWPDHDPLFPRAWSDRLGEYFRDVELREIDDAGHFAPLEFPQAIAAAVRDVR